MIESTEEKYVGTWILGQYRIERMLDAGGMGTVYLAKQASMDRNAAVKIIDQQPPRRHCSDCQEEL
jgi:serine/threonine protein kinase